jgi:hypothetical protein
MQAIRDDRMHMLKMDSLRSLIFILLGGAVIFGLIFTKIKKEYLFGALIVLVLADMFPVNKRFLNNENFTSKSRVENPFEPSQANSQILADPDPNFRVLNLASNTFNDAGTSYFHKSIGGYHGAKLRRYQELIEESIQPEIQTFAGKMSTDSTPVINMLNTKYFILPGREGGQVAFPNQGALGNAWFVSGYQVVSSADEEIRALRNFRPDSIAIADKRFSDQISGLTLSRSAGDSIWLTAYAPNKLDYQYKTAQKGLAVFSEIYYPKGWNAYLNGTPVPHFRVNYVLRAMVLPAGEGKIEFRFEPSVYTTGETISMASSALLLLLLIAGLGLEIRNMLKKEA